MPTGLHLTSQFAELLVGEPSDPHPVFPRLSSRAKRRRLCDLSRASVPLALVSSSKPEARSPLPHVPPKFSLCEAMLLLRGSPGPQWPSGSGWGHGETVLRSHPSWPCPRGLSLLLTWCLFAGPLPARFLLFPQTIARKFFTFVSLQRSDALLSAEVNKPCELSWQFFRAACRPPAVGQQPPALQLRVPQPGTQGHRGMRAACSLSSAMLQTDGDSFKPEPGPEPGWCGKRLCLLALAPVASPSPAQIPDGNG